MLRNDAMILITMSMHRSALHITYDLHFVLNLLLMLPLINGSQEQRFSVPNYGRRRGLTQPPRRPRIWRARQRLHI